MTSPSVLVHLTGNKKAHASFKWGLLTSTTNNTQAADDILNPFHWFINPFRSLFHFPLSIISFIQLFIRFQL